MAELLTPGGIWVVEEEPREPARVFRVAVEPVFSCRLCGCEAPEPPPIGWLRGGWDDCRLGCGHERPLTCPECVKANPDDFPRCSVCGCELALT